MLHLIKVVSFWKDIIAQSVIWYLANWKIWKIEAKRRPPGLHICWVFSPQDSAVTKLIVDRGLESLDAYLKFDIKT